MLTRRVLVVLAVLAAANVAGAGDDAKEKSAALKVLEYSVGTWHEEAVSKVAEWTPKEVRLATVSHKRLILGGRVLEGKGVWKPANDEFLHLITYDTEKKEYRNWYFDSNGTMPRGEDRGKWDETTKTMTWKGNPGPGLISEGSLRHIDNNNLEWTFVVRDGEGKVYLNMQAKAKRIKGKK